VDIQYYTEFMGLGLLYGCDLIRSLQTFIICEITKFDENENLAMNLSSEIMDNYENVNKRK